MGGLLLLWQRDLVARLVKLDWEALNERWASKLVVVGLLSVFFGVIYLLGRYRITVTDNAVGRDLRLLGFPIIRYGAEFTAITKIVCGKNGPSSAVWIEQKQGGRFHLADFSSADERDWVAEELNKLWRNATGR